MISCVCFMRCFQHPDSISFTGHTPHENKKSFMQTCPYIPIIRTHPIMLDNTVHRSSSYTNMCNAGNHLL